MLQILLIFLMGIIIWFLYDHKKHADYPPGPTRIPILGSLLQIARQSPFPHVAFQKLSREYGDIIYVRMGFTDAITFNSLESIRDMLNHEHTTERVQNMLPLMHLRNSDKNIGIIFSNGKDWQTIRRFTIRTLRDFGFGKAASMDVAINQELEKFIIHLEELNSQEPNGIPEAHSLFDLTMVNVLWRLVTGVEYELNDSNIQRLLQVNHELFQTTNMSMDLAIAFPKLYDLFPNWMGKVKQYALMNKLKNFVRDSIDERRKLGDYQISPKSYVDEFLVKIEENKGNPNTEFTDDNLLICLLDLFQTGSDTTSNTLSFAMLYMILYPDIQGKVQAEIDANVPENESIILETRSRLPYTYATLLECMRYSTVAPFPPARQASEDFFFQGHLIKKGMALLPNIHAIHFSEDLWKDPDNFQIGRAHV